MPDLQFEKITDIHESITHLDGLVAVFSQKDGAKLLHVYLEKPDLPPIPALRTISLRRLLNEDLSEYDGPIAGFAALDIIRDDLPTKGPLFYPIEQIFKEHKQHKTLSETMRYLARELLQRLGKPSDREPDPIHDRQIAKVLRLALPSMLYSRECENLIAIVPSHNLERFVVEGDCTFVYHGTSSMDVLEGVDTTRDWVVALEELSRFYPGIQAHHSRFLELRLVLRPMRQTRKEVALRKTLQQLARDCLGAASSDYFELAMGLMVEYWLTSEEAEEVEDLVAICPSNDFERFVETGDALYVYRAPPEGALRSARSGPVWSLEQLIREGLPEGYNRHMLSFAAIKDCISTPQPLRYRNLGGVLWKARHWRQLGRTLWLLSRDLIEMAPSATQWDYDYISEMLNLAVRSCTIYGLSNPWKWRHGRWELYAENAYRNLQHILDQIAGLVGEPLSDYYQALKHWYSCAVIGDTSSDIGGHLVEMLNHLQKFVRAVQGQPAPGVDLHEVEQLLAIGRVLLYRLGDTGKPERSIYEIAGEIGAQRPSVPDVVRDGVREVEPATPSPLFLFPWNALITKRRKRQDLEGRERDVDVLTGELRGLAGELKRAQRVLFAAVHERAVLEFAYQEEIDRIETLLRELETSARLTVELKNSVVDLHHDMYLVFEITNAGQVDAEELKVALQPKGFQLVEDDPFREIASLGRGESIPIRYHIRPERRDAELRLVYTVTDGRNQSHTNALSTRLEVRDLDEKPPRMKANHYEFGPPIQNPANFYGRRREIQSICSWLNAGTKKNILLHGARRIGKTSLLHMIERALSDPAARRLFDLPTTWDRGLDQVSPLLLSFQSFEREAGELRVHQFFRTLLERSADQFAIAPAERRSIMEDFMVRASQVGAVNAAREQIDRILRMRPDQRVVVLLDEYDEVYQPGSSSLDINLRDFVSQEQRLSWIITSTQGLYREQMSLSSPWFNVFEITKLGPLSEKAARDLVEAPSLGEGVFWRSDAVLKLMEQTGRHPFYMQLFCSKVIDYLNQAQTNYVLEDTIADVAEQLLADQQTAQSHFQFYWSDTSGIGRLILLILDDFDVPLTRDEIRHRVRTQLDSNFGDRARRPVQEPKADGSVEPIEWWYREFKRGMSWVETVVNAISPDSQRRYIFTIPLFRRWLRRRRQHESPFTATLAKISREMERDESIPAA